ncbi:MAG: 30S ribosomal protein S7 [candidate division Zixibacteria bacterium RBG_16_53_22]|nr:MAG: 30S ribosomal protein S7 [candidate division Zixibacteria bacterium RBG_16_53_22]
MPRRKKIIKKERTPDQRYGQSLVTQFINGLMGRGKKSVAEQLFYGAVDSVGEKTGQTGIEVFQKALNNIKPMLEVRSRRVGGANYQVPVEVRPARRTALAIRWLISYARTRPEHTMAEKLAAEIIAASRNEGAAVKKKEDTHKMAEANKAFAHFRW